MYITITITVYNDDNNILPVGAGGAAGALGGPGGGGFPALGGPGGGGFPRPGAEGVDGAVVVGININNVNNKIPVSETTRT